MNNNISELLTSSMEKLEDIVDVNSIIGTPITTPDGVTILPVCKVKIGLGGGGTDFTTKNARPDRDMPFGGGVGCGINIDPVAFLVIRGESVRLMPIAEPASTTLDRIVELAPDLIDKLADFIDSRKEKKAD